MSLPTMYSKAQQTMTSTSWNLVEAQFRKCATRRIDFQDWKSIWSV